MFKRRKALPGTPVAEAIIGWTRRLLVLTFAITAAVTVTGAAPANAWTGNCHTAYLTPFNNYETEVTNTNGRKERYTRGYVGQNYILRQYQLSNGSWTGWNYFTSDGLTLSAVPAVVNRDGRVVVFVVGTDNKVHYVYQTTPGDPQSYSGWISLDGYATANPLILINKDKRIEVFVRGSDNALHHRWQNLDYTWSDWTTLGGQLTSYPYGEPDSDGRLQVHARGTDCHKWTIGQVTAGGSWGAWSKGEHLG